MFLIKTDENLWDCGANICGQLGVGDNLFHSYPTRILYWNELI